MSTIQKVLSSIRDLADEELDHVGGLEGTAKVVETWSYCTPEGHTIAVPDKVTTVTSSD